MTSTISSAASIWRVLDPLVPAVGDLRNSEQAFLWEPSLRHWRRIIRRGLYQDAVSEIYLAASCGVSL
jgi:hypothetical protein